MHLTLKKAATKPAADNLLQQQARFDEFLECFNNERPHQALAMNHRHKDFQFDDELRAYFVFNYLAGRPLRRERFFAIGSWRFAAVSVSDRDVRHRSIAHLATPFLSDRGRDD